MERSTAGIFDAASTTDDLLRNVDLNGKRVLVTGVSTGPSVEIARSLAAHGAQVVGAARHLRKAEAAMKQVQVQAANGGGLDLVSKVRFPVAPSFVEAQDVVAANASRAANTASGAVCENSRWRSTLTVATTIMIAPTTIPRPRPAWQAISTALTISKPPVTRHH